MLQLCIFFYLIEISVIHRAEYKLPSIREICICMLVYAYENEVLKKKYLALESMKRLIGLIDPPRSALRSRLSGVLIGRGLENSSR